MTKNGLIAAVAEDAAKSKTDVVAVLTSLAAIVSTTLKGGGELTLGGIGRLSAATPDKPAIPRPAR